MSDLEFRQALLADPIAQERSRRLAEVFAEADPARLDAALQAGDIDAAQRELGLSDAEFVQIAADLDRARQSALRRASRAGRAV